MAARGGSFEMPKRRARSVWRGVCVERCAAYVSRVRALRRPSVRRGVTTCRTRGRERVTFCNVT